jgi:superfamily I DNA and/or RNA helicase
VHILACAPSASAADTIALRLIPHFKPGEMYRINTLARSFAEVPLNLMVYCHTMDSYFAFPSWDNLMSAKVVVTDCMGAFELIQARCTNRDLEKVQEYYYKAFGITVKQWHWTHLFVDEAAQASEPETLIPMMVVAPGVNAEIPMPKVVFAGDSNQLGPAVMSPIARENGLDVSLFERLSQREIYSQHPLSRANLFKRPANEGWYRPAFVNLIRNYRSHKGILMMPSAMFYDSTLLDEAPASTESLTSWTALSNPRIPVLFYPSKGEEIWIQDTGGWFNPSEIVITTKLITNLLREENTPGTAVKQMEIAVIAPFREHVVRLRNTLRRMDLGAVSIGTVENYQGDERRVTILNCVRANKRFLDWDQKKGSGLVNQRRRFNVAITRAKELLVIVGNPDVLQVPLMKRGKLTIGG